MSRNEETGFRSAEDRSLEEVAGELRRAAGASKCWPCGCLHRALTTVEGALPPGDRPAAVQQAVSACRERLRTEEYECLGCAECFPALALNALADTGHVEAAGSGCAAASVEPRAGWPPLPGDFRVLRYQAPVAVCTLADRGLMEEVVAQASDQVAIVGTLATENLGIERLVENVAANPWIRTVVVCGEEPEAAVGHRPGGSLLAFARAGVDDRCRIVGAPGRRPFLKNVDAEAMKCFRSHVRVIDSIGCRDPAAIARLVQEAAEGTVEPRPVPRSASSIRILAGRLPARLTMDPSGWFVVHVDQLRGRLVLEHYTPAGVLDAVIHGHRATEVYSVAIEEALVGRLDHAAYLGRELARAEHALEEGTAFVQDRAPEAEADPEAAASGCGCANSEGGCP